ncbi:MAG: hypothetical protein R2867_45425 [Caldilineaceae bacterium]
MRQQAPAHLRHLATPPRNKRRTHPGRTWPSNDAEAGPPSSPPNQRREQKAAIGAFGEWMVDSFQWTVGQWTVDSFQWDSGQ